MSFKSVGNSPSGPHDHSWPVAGAKLNGD
ncbi:hypothetical protein THAOC_29789, partial [Thalassiosira oceanica]